MRTEHAISQPLGILGTHQYKVYYPDSDEQKSAVNIINSEFDKPLGTNQSMEAPAGTDTLFFEYNFFNADDDKIVYLSYNEDIKEEKRNMIFYILSKIVFNKLFNFVLIVAIFLVGLYEKNNIFLLLLASFPFLMSIKVSNKVTGSIYGKK